MCAFGDASVPPSVLWAQLYTGGCHDRKTHRSDVGTVVNTGYYGADSLIDEFLSASTEIFGEGCDPPLCS